MHLHKWVLLTNFIFLAVPARRIKCNSMLSLVRYDKERKLKLIK
jgi:hypothetical protein